MPPSPPATAAPAPVCSSSAAAERQTAEWSASLQGKYSTRPLPAARPVVRQTSAPLAPVVLGQRCAHARARPASAPTSLYQSDWQGRHFRDHLAELRPHGRPPRLRRRLREPHDGVGPRLDRRHLDHAELRDQFERDGDFLSQQGQPERTPARQPGPAIWRRCRCRPARRATPASATEFSARPARRAATTGDGSWQNEVSTLTAGVARQGRNDGFRAGASGGVALMPEGVFFARRIDGSFAVVEVSDYPNVRG